MNTRTCRIACIAVALFGLGGCTSDSTEGDSVVVEVRAGRAVDLPKTARAHLVLYGIDSAMADQPASVVAAYDGLIERLPATVGLDLPARPTERIDPLTSEPRPRWYLHIEISAAGDFSVRCPGDWIEDYDRSPFSATGSIAELPRELWVKEVAPADGGCLSLSR